MSVEFQIIGVLYAIMSVVTFIAYAIDKRRAVRHQWRIPERQLHLLELLGGWPGGLAGQILLRHKRQKFRYMFVFALIVAMHVAAWAWYFLHS